MNKKFAVLFVLMLVASLFSGCYWRKQVEASEVGVELKDGVTVTDVVSSGRYTDMGYYAELKVINVSNLTTEWVDESLVTADKQPIGLKLAITFRRNRNSEAIEAMWEEYRAEVTSDDAFARLVHSRVPSAAKAITTRYTLDQMLGIEEGENAIGREQVEAELFEILANELVSVYGILEKVSIADIKVSDNFLAALENKAQAQINREIAQQQTLTLQETLKQEQAQTAIALEIANRENEVNQTLAEAFEDSPQLFELRKLELLAQLLDENDLVIYVPEGTDIATVIGGSGVVPLPQE